MIHGLGLVVLVIGVHLFLETRELLIVLGRVLLGGILGELLRIEDRLNGIGRWLERRTKAETQEATAQTDDAETHTGQSEETPRADRTRFSQAYLTASLVFCVGPMTILGSFQDGLTGDYKVLAIKSMLDFFAAMAFASTMGLGLLDLRRIRTGNLLPAIAIAPIIVAAVGWLPSLWSTP